MDPKRISTEGGIFPCCFASHHNRNDKRIRKKEGKNERKKASKQTKAARLGRRRAQASSSELPPPEAGEGFPDEPRMIDLVTRFLGKLNLLAIYIELIFL